MPSNYASAITARQYYATHGNFTEAPAWFRHNAATGTPAAPTYPGALTTAEQDEVAAWRNGSQGDVSMGGPSGPAPTLAAAIAKVAEYETYFASASYKAWLDADRMARAMQWRWFCADALDLNAATLSPSADATGAGSSAPSASIPQSLN